MPGPDAEPGRRGRHGALSLEPRRAAGVVDPLDLGPAQAGRAAQGLRDRLFRREAPGERVRPGVAFTLSEQPGGQRRGAPERRLQPRDVRDVDADAYDHTPSLPRLAPGPARRDSRPG